MESPRPPLPPDVAHLIRERAFASLSAAASGTTQLALSPVLYPSGHVFVLPDARVAVRRESALVFVDERPGHNWGHPCRYQFFDPRTGELIQEEQAFFPPDLEPGVHRLETFHAPVPMTARQAPQVLRRVDWRSILRSPVFTIGPVDERYALLWTSQISNRRHVEDLEFCYRTLLDVYGFAADHIKVLSYNGTLSSIDYPALGDWVGDNTPYRMKIDGAATVANLQSALDDLGKRMNDKSLLFVHTNNHGSQTGMCVDYSSVILPATFGTMLAGLPRIQDLVVTMEQCYSGAFQQGVLGNSTAARTVFASAVNAYETSAGAAHFDPWAENLIAAFAGGTPYGAALPIDPDANNNGAVSVKEACDYAKAENTVGDDPQYADSPMGCGAHVYLGRLPSIPPWLVHELLEEIARIPVPIPDPGPLRPGGLDIAQLQFAAHVVGLLKSAPSRVGTGPIQLPDQPAAPVAGAAAVTP